MAKGLVVLYLQTDVLMRRLIREFAAFTWSKKRFWLLPILVALLGVGGLVLFSKGSALSYFIYPLF